MVAVCAGVTGLIGSQLLALLLEDNYYSKVIALTRKPLSFKHPRLENLVTDLDKLEDVKDLLRADDIFCCLGTTMGKAGSRQAFKRVDLEYPLALARVTKEQGAKQYLIVTARGASKDSFIFYNRVKGEVQEALLQTGFESIHIFQPSLLIGPRLENRPGEKFFQKVMGVLGFLIPRNSKPVESIRVARAMQAIAKQGQKGINFYGSGELQQYKS